MNDDGKFLDNLERSLELNVVDRNLWSDKCDYLNIEQSKNLNPDSLNFIIMQLNMYEKPTCTPNGIEISHY